MEQKELMETVLAARAGDSQACGRLYEAFRDMVYSIALRETKSPSLAEDIVQETFLEMMRSVHALREPEAFPAWLKAIACHQCTRYYKRKETRHELTVDTPENLAILNSLQENRSAHLPEEAADRKALRETLLAMLEQLPDAQSSALRMFYYDELPLKTIAQAQGVSVNTANTRLNRGRLAVKKSIDDYERKHGVRLHVLAFFPLFRWLLGDTDVQMPPKAAARISGEIARKRANVRKLRPGKAIKGVSLGTKITAGAAALAIAAGTPAAVRHFRERPATPENVAVIQTAASRETTVPMVPETTAPAARLGDFLDLSKTWSYQVELEGRTYMVSHAFCDDGTFDSFLGGPYSEILAVFPGTYFFDGETLSLAYQGVEGVIACDYAFDPARLMLVQTSEQGLLYCQAGDSLQLYADETNTPERVRELCRMLWGQNVEADP